MTTEPERLLNDLERRIDQLKHKVEIQGINISNDIANIKQDIKELRSSDTGFITQERYAPVERLVYGFVGLVLVAVLMAIIALVVRNPT
jgi:hypothetical protein